MFWKHFKKTWKTFKKIGIYLNGSCFAHRLYVTLSRVKLSKILKIFITDEPQQGKFKFRNNRHFTKNVVYQNVVEQIQPTNTFHRYSQQPQLIIPLQYSTSIKNIIIITTAVFTTTITTNNNFKHSKLGQASYSI